FFASVMIAVPAHPLHPELLIKIAIVNFTAPADAYRVVAHETSDSRRIECIDQKLHILIEFVGVAQVSGKSADWKIAEREDSVKHDPEMLLQLALVIAFKLILRRGQKCSHRIINEMQRQ